MANRYCCIYWDQSRMDSCVFPTWGNDVTCDIELCAGRTTTGPHATVRSRIPRRRVVVANTKKKPLAVGLDRSAHDSPSGSVSSPQARYFLPQCPHRPPGPSIHNAQWCRNINSRAQQTCYRGSCIADQSPASVAPATAVLVAVLWCRLRQWDCW